MSDISRISSYQSYDRLIPAQIAAAILLALVLHAVVLAFFYLKPSPPTTVRQQIIDVSLDLSPSSATPNPDRHTVPPRTLATTSETAPTPAKETAPQTPPVNTETTAALPSVPPVEKIQTLSSLTRIPSPLKKIDAVYPASERRAGIQAYVLAEVIIDAQGKVQDIHILKSGGIAFDTTVIDALKNSAFTPGYIGDKAVPVRISIPFRFNLN